MLVLALIFGLTRAYGADVVPSATGLRAELARHADSAPPPQVREAWVRYAERTGDTLPVGVALAALPPTTLTDAERALLLYDRARRAAWSEDADTLLSLTEGPRTWMSRPPSYERADVLRAWLLRADLLARGDAPTRAFTTYRMVLTAQDPRTATPEERGSAGALRVRALAALASAYAAAGRPDAAEAVASRVDEASEAYPPALALRAAGELSDGVIAEGLGHMLALDGPLAGRWFAPSTEVWAAVGAANACDAASARDRLARYHAHMAAVRAALDPTSPLFARLADGRLQPGDPDLAPWIAADAELASLVRTIALLRAEGSPELAADMDAYTNGVRQRLNAKRAHAEAAIAEADAFAARVAAAIEGRTDADPFRVRMKEAHRQPMPFNGEFWLGELDNYRVWYERRCDVIPTGHREVDFG